MKSSLNVRKGLDAVTSGDSNRGSVGAAQTANDKGLARPPHSDNSGQVRLESAVFRGCPESTEVGFPD